MAVKRPRTYLKWYAAITIAGLSAITAFNFAVDPLHFYHRPFLHHTFVGNQRFQNPGLAKNYDYDAVVIGTSHTENFSAAQIGRALGWKVMKLSMSGSTAYEQRCILQKALGTGKVKHVLWGLDFDSFCRNSDDVAVGKGNFPFYLYDETVQTPLQYLWSRDTLGFSWRAIFGRGVQDLDRLHAWSDRFEYSEARTIAAFRYEQETGHRTSPAAQVVLNSTPAEAIAANIRLHVVPLVAAHPEVTFHCFFPPYSVLAYADDFTLSEDRFEARLKFKEGIVESIGDYANVQTSDFETAFEITQDLGNYKDLTHYNRRINDYIVDSIAKGDWTINRENYCQKLDEFADSVHAFLREALAANSPWHEKLGLAQTAVYFHDPRGQTLAKPGPQLADDPARGAHF